MKKKIHLYAVERSFSMVMDHILGLISFPNSLSLKKDSFLGANGDCHAFNGLTSVHSMSIYISTFMERCPFLIGCGLMGNFETLRISNKFLSMWSAYAHLNIHL